ncbi:TlpA family protein disulfide reductase [Aquimarina intermedia]|uniref:Thiol-disulfide isomerase/thioredoxin n=1 Tax=Aquimarina intermedia TaxID=350814 RepID=A0A5S5C0F2_9FLAO|nr:TlpA disulfide reductase family protein [Aquimarina intermedia]TYP72895.1 thiol-disulfide isomerase/thioredoxin [Aquimarina intermedia]
MRFNNKNISNLIFVFILVLFLIPYTRGVIQVYITRILAFSPSVVEQKDRQYIASYDWKLEGVNTSGVDLKNLEGEVILINFWATWCPPCIAEMPSLQELHTDYKDTVAFLFVSNEENVVLNKFIKSKGYNFPIYRSRSEFPEPLDGSSLPTTYVIDKGGAIIMQKVGAADWNSKSVRRLLDSLIVK